MTKINSNLYRSQNLPHVIFRRVYREISNRWVSLFLLRAKREGRILQRNLAFTYLREKHCFYCLRLAAFGLMIRNEGIVTAMTRFLHTKMEFLWDFHEILHSSDKKMWGRIFKNVTHKVNSFILYLIYFLQLWHHLWMPRVKLYFQIKIFNWLFKKKIPKNCKIIANFITFKLSVSQHSHNPRQIT